MPWPAPTSFDLVVPRDELADWWDRLTAAGARPAGTLAFEALRVGRVRPRLGLDTDDRTIPHEVGWIGVRPVHLDEGLLPRPGDGGPGAQHRQAAAHLVLLHLDGGRRAPAGARRPGHGGRPRGRPGRHGRSTTTSSARSRWPWSSARSPPTPSWWPARAPPSIDPDSVPADDTRPGGPAAVDRLRGR